MTREEVIKGLNDIHAVACGLCDDECYLNSIGIKQLRALIDGATALLKAQEPRVMTLEEALGGDECWVEYPNGGCGYADCYLSYTTKGADIYRTMQHDFNVPLATYGKTWRCWTSRPTDEQMKAVKWP